MVIGYWSLVILIFFPLIDLKRKTEARQKPPAAYRFFLPLIMDAIFIVILFQGLGYAFDIGHMIFLIVAFFGGVMIMAGVPIAYSLILYLRKKKEPVTREQ